MYSFKEHLSFISNDLSDFELFIAPIWFYPFVLMIVFSSLQSFGLKYHFHALSHCIF